MEVQEWLNNNELSCNIFNKKYRNDNETLEEFFERVSHGYEPIKKLIREKKFLFGGRILASRGVSNRKVTYSNCFLAGTKVLTKAGYKNIEEIEIGDYVYSHSNTWNRVNEVMSRPYKGNIYKIISSNLLEPIFCTPNHKFLTNSGEWKAIENFIIKSVGHNRIDKLTSPDECIYHKWENITVDLTENFVCEANKRLVFNDNIVGIEAFMNDRGTNIWRRPKYFINRYFELDEEVLYLIGRWVGDGSITKRTNKVNPSIWQIVFNATTEKDVCNICFNIVKTHFPLLNPIIRETDQNVLSLRVENEIFSTWFENNFGHGCSGKYIPKWIGYPRNLLLGLLDADGSVHSQGDFKLLLKNSELIQWARKALFNLGINASNIKSETRQVADYFSIFKNQNRKLIPYLNKKYKDDRMNVNLGLDKTSIKIDDLEVLENFNTVVYNLSVENDHSYLVNGVFAHNCYVIQRPNDNIESIFDCAAKLARTYSYGGGCGIDLSNLRPNGATVHNAAKTTCGPVGFMDIFSQTTATIGQAGRRGQL